MKWNGKNTAIDPTAPFLVSFTMGMIINLFKRVPQIGEEGLSASVFPSITIHPANFFVIVSYDAEFGFVYARFIYRFSKLLLYILYISRMNMLQNVVQEQLLISGFHAKQEIALFVPDYLIRFHMPVPGGQFTSSRAMRKRSSDTLRAASAHARSRRLQMRAVSSRSRSISSSRQL